MSQTNTNPQENAAPPGTFRRGGIARSFVYAGQGIGYVLRTQRNFRIHVTAACAVMIAAYVAGFSATEWAILVLVIAGVMILEMLNTVTETIVDLVSPEYHPLAKIAKDVAAGAVLVAAIAAVIVGALLFWRHVMP